MKLYTIKITQHALNIPPIMLECTPNKVME